MKQLVRNVFVAVLGIGLAGCEWSGSGDDNSWNDSGTLANFNGSYRGGGSGGYLVSEYSTSSSGAAGGTTTYKKEQIGTGEGAGRTAYDGTLKSPVVPTSVTIVAGGYTFTDPGGGSILVGTIPGTVGTITYPSGGWTIDLGGGGILEDGIAITATYTVTNSGSQSSGVPGSTDPIYVFNVQQSGNKIKIIDNNGSVYEGSLGDMRTTGNLGSGSQGSTFVNGDQVIATFSASGRSAAGIYVNMTGNFQGTVQGVSTVTTKSGSSTITTTSMALSDRRIIGTWIEDGGKTGDISGVSASAVNVSLSSSTSTNSI